MKVQLLSNGSLQILLSPEDEMEEAFINKFCKQTNDITQIRQQIHVLAHTYNKGILIGKKEVGVISPEREEGPLTDGE